MKIKLLTLFILITLQSNSQTFNGATVFGGSTIDNAQAMHQDSDGNIYVSGLFSSTMTLGTTTITTSGGNADGYLAKFDSTGVPQWIKKFGSNYDEVARNVTTDSNGNILITGYFQGTTFDANPDPTAVFTLAQTSMILSRDCFIIKLDPNGDFVWAKQISNPIGGAVNEDSYDIKCDSNNNIYVAGRFMEADFDTSTASNVVTSYGTNYATDGFILKLDLNGNSIWVKKFGGITADVITSIKIDNLNNVYATGIFTGTADFDPSSSTASSTSNGNNDIFVVKLDTNGNYLFHKAIGGSAADYVNYINVDNSGKIYIAGYFNGTIDLDPSGTAANVTSNGAWDNFLLKLDANGDYISHYTSGSTGNDQIYGIELTNSNSVILSGIYGQIFDIDPSSAIVNTTFTGGSSDIFILELDQNLGYVNHYLFGSTGSETLPWCKTNGNDITVVGAFQNTIDLNPSSATNNFTSSGSYDVFMTRFTSNLSLNEIKNTKIASFPNPFHDVLQINNSVVTNYAVYSLCGLKVGEGAILNNEIDLSRLGNGIYLIEYKSKDQTFVEKIIKQ